MPLSADQLSSNATSRLTVLNTPSIEPITATGRPRIAFHFGSLPHEVIESSGDHAVVSRMDLLGQKTSAGLYSSASRDVDSYVMELSPLMLRRLFPNTPAWTLTDKRIPILNCMRESADLFRALSLANPIDRTSIAVAWADEYGCTSSFSFVAAALDAIFAAGGSASMQTLVDDLGVSMRTLQLKFRDEIGISPKLMCSQVRCQLAAQLCSPDGKKSWVATDCNYFDQPHMNREFRRFLGMTPKQTAIFGYWSTRIH